MNDPITPEKTWWQRNWKWAVPSLGCLTIIIAIVAAVGFGAFTFFNKIKSASGDDAIMEKVATSALAKKYLGTPIEEDGFGNRSVNLQNDTKTVEATLPVKGPKGDGILKVKSTTYGDTTIYEILTLQVKEPPRVIDLLEENEVVSDTVNWD
ncbi:MAG: cytochrome c oxidase assembly factor Coa1 family protein [Leeuwenhoekiella sp.]